MEEAEAAGENYGNVEGRTQREIVWKRFKRHQLALVGGAILLLLYIGALLTPYVAPYGFAEQDFTSMNQGPSLSHPMGTDQLGRDELTRVMYGGRISLLVGLGVGAFVTVVRDRRGYSLGVLQQVYRRRV